MATHGDILIRPHQVMTCPKCRTYAEFLEHVYSRELPVLLQCGSCEYQYRLDDVTRRAFNLPKRDGRVPCSAAWKLIRLDDETNSPVQGQSSPDGHADIIAQMEAIPPELRTRSIHERIEELASMMIVMKRVEYSIRRDFRTACEAFVDDVNGAISPYAHLRGYMDVDGLVDFLERPFLTMPLDFATDQIQKLSRLILSLIHI